MRFRTGGQNWEGRQWTLVPGLVVLGQQISTLHPQAHATDGTVASKAHDAANPTSDHRPHPYSGPGRVRALDFGENTENDAFDVLESIRLSRDPRVKYVIHERRLFSSYPSGGIDPYTWRPYSGPAPHDNHGHISTLPEFDTDTRQWSITEDTMPHKHIPMPDELPRDWADLTWAEWVKESGTDPNSRTWTFYREDLSWVYSRVIKPLVNRIDALERRVADLEAAGGGSDMPTLDIRVVGRVLGQ
jgi:hypothetical protein